MIMDGVVTPVASDAMTAQDILIFTLCAFGVLFPGVLIVMWFKGEL